MICINCNESMKVIHMRDLVDGKAYPNRKRLISLMDSKQTNVICICESCGKLEFPKLPKQNNHPIFPSREAAKSTVGEFKNLSQLSQILLEQEDLTIAPDINTLLKFKPGKSRLAELTSKIRHPIEKRLVEAGILLSYKSSQSQFPHKFLIEPIFQEVKFLAIHNDHNAFDLNNLSTAYGSFEYVQRIEQYRFWFFDEDGVAFVTPEKYDDQVIYVQFFENRMRFERYIELQCFFKETFS